MSQLTIYLKEDTLKRIKQAAAKEKRSVSDWAREQLELGAKDTWPDGYFELFGSIQDASFRRSKQPAFENDVPRESFD